MITIEQCRAARGLLGWTQQDLADACGLSKTAINNFEKSHSDIKAESLRAIRMAFESLNIEFLGQEGLRRTNEHTEILKGATCYHELIDDILLSATNEGDALLIIDTNQYAEEVMPQEKLNSCIAQLLERGVQTKIITAPNSKVAASGATTRTSAETYKYMPSIFIYADKFSEQRTKNQFLTLTVSSDESKAMREKFETIWAEASEETKAATAEKKAL